MPLKTASISLTTRGNTDIHDLTPELSRLVEGSGLRSGTVTVFCPSSTSGLTTIEYETGVLRDLKRAIEKVAPSDIPYEHDRRWGDGNGFSHVRAALMKPSLTIPLVGEIYGLNLLPILLTAVFFFQMKVTTASQPKPLPATGVLTGSCLRPSVPKS